VKKALRFVLPGLLAALSGRGALGATAPVESAHHVVIAAAPAPAAPSELADAAMHRDYARLQALLKGHADVNGSQPDGSTALHWAAYQGDAHGHDAAAAGLRGRQC
jgi:hypothetical protein